MNLARRKVEIGVWLAAIATTAVCAFRSSGGRMSWTGAAFMAYMAFPYVMIPLVTSVIYFRPSQVRPPIRRGLVLAMVLCAIPTWAYIETAFFPGSSTAALTFLFLPVWIVLGAVVLVPLLLGRPSPESRPGDCHTCGYNLTGNVSGICPECGSAVRKNTWAA